MDVIGVDTTFLVEATVQETPRHTAARRYLREAVVSRQVSLAVAPHRRVLSWV